MRIFTNRYLLLLQGVRILDEELKKSSLGVRGYIG
jgi:hypothetical protein